ncbi:MAG: phosphoenolpyruvate synthase, partial [Xanthomonadales bacterium]|nr:phosphoenolpyruvate synthase [Xanthomonadales bacterium]
MAPYVIPLDQLGLSDLETVGGKNASLGEMITNLSQAGVNVPGGFATTADAYRKFLQHEGLAERIDELLQKLDVDNIAQLTSTGAQIRQWLLNAPLPDEARAQIVTAWETMSAGQDDSFSVAVRSSATAEDLPDASFAGQQETFLNVRGLDQLLQSVVKVYASLYTDRAIAYRVHQGYDHHD